GARRVSDDCVGQPPRRDRYALESDDHDAATLDRWFTNWVTVRQRDAAERTLRLSAMVMWIVFAASMFTALYTAIGAEGLVRDALSAMPGGRWGIIVGMQLVWLVMGCFLDPLGIMIITAPLFFPIATRLGFDPVWFGVLFVVNMEMAFLTPPFGFNLFYMRSVVPKDISMGDIYLAVLPFIALQATGLVIMMIFPEIILFLPRLVLG
ncbi:MAG: TRAP transporter large permease subunit, partial [Elioraea tepidiphila]